MAMDGSDLPSGGIVGAEPAPVGFRHLFGPPAGPVQVRRKDPDALARLMPGLARLMHAPDPRGRVGGLGNPNLPAGYTYLMQMVGHDLVDSTAFPSTAAANGEQPRNLRASALRLDTLYGGGPSGCPFAYAPEPGGRPDSLPRLQLGRLAPAPGADAAAGDMPLRDLPRLPAGELTGAVAPRRSIALVADARSDGNVNAAQLTVLFAAFHNAVLAAIAPPAAQPAARRDLDAVRFACAREVVTAAYRRVVRDDLLKRLLDPAVYDHYVRDGEPLLDEDAVRGGPGRAPDARLPLEFALGAIRVGHGMVRDAYRFNDAASQELPGILSRTSLRGPAGVPLSAAWAWRFANFFDFGGDAGVTGAPRLNLSRRIGPRYSAGLQLESRFGAFDATGTIGLAYRDLLSAVRAGLWPVPDLYERVRTLRAELLDGAALADEAARRAALVRWLRASPVVSGFDDDAVAALVRDPPLGFYVLVEADAEQAGERLGRLGSIIVAEAVLAAMARDPLRSDAGGPGAMVERLLGVRLPPDLATVADMPALVRFTARHGGLDAPDLPFI